MKNNIRKLTLSAMFLAMCLLLPFLTGQIPEIGNMLCPMHIPVLLCGIICGWQYGAVVGFIAPVMRSAIFSAPVMMPAAVSMAFELATYGIIIGILYSSLKKNNINIYVSLIAAMIGGRVVWGVARFIIAQLTGSVFSFQMYLSGALLTAIPGIICQIILIPIIIIALKKAHLLEEQ